MKNQPLLQKTKTKALEELVHAGPLRVDDATRERQIAKARTANCDHKKNSRLKRFVDWAQSTLTPAINERLEKEIHDDDLDCTFVLSQDIDEAFPYGGAG